MRPIYLVFGLPMLCVSGCGMFAWIQGALVRRELDALLHEARRDGLALDRSILRPQEPVLPEENAADLYRKAYEIAPDRYWIGDFNQAFSGGDIAPKEALRQMREWDGALKLAVTAAEKPKLDFGRHWPPEWDLAHPEYWPHRELCSMMALYARVLSRNGEPLAALDIVERGFRAAEHIRAEPIFYALEIQSDSESWLFEAAAEILADNPSNQHVLNRAASMKLPQSPPLSKFVSGEAAFLWSVASRDDLREHMGTVPHARNVRWYPAFMVEKARVRMLQEMLATYRASSKGDVQEIRKALQAQARVWRAGPASVLADRLWMKPGKLANRWSFREANVRIWKCGLAALSQKQTTGKYPGALPDLGKDAKDPFGSGTLKYKAGKRQARIYSVGPNGLDNAGGADDIGMTF